MLGITLLTMLTQLYPLVPGVARLELVRLWNPRIPDEVLAFRVSANARTPAEVRWGAVVLAHVLKVEQRPLSSPETSI